MRPLSFLTMHVSLYLLYPDLKQDFGLGISAFRHLFFDKQLQSLRLSISRVPAFESHGVGCAD